MKYNISTQGKYLNEGWGDVGGAMYSWFKVVGHLNHYIHHGTFYI